MSQREQDDAARLESALDRIVRALARLPQPWQDGAEPRLPAGQDDAPLQPASALPGLDAESAAALAQRLDILITDLRQALGAQDEGAGDATPSAPPGPGTLSDASVRPANDPGLLAPPGNPVDSRQPSLPAGEAPDPAALPRGLS